ncbi:MAG TPA: septal ring lytic transglycosylase RlpA family protein [Thermoanaerobaculia bacterium]|nr:septal ring lytic transglycosylase RlpA family protein [Thermoanaerobaculia bacterium]
MASRSSRISALAGILASAALVSSACSGNHHPVSPAPAAGSLTRGTASWYGPKFNGHRTASGERYDMRKLTAAHPSLPFGTMLQVTNLENGKQVVVRVNDRGPFGRRRVIDLSYAAARELDMVGPGTAQVELALLGRYDQPAQLAQPMLLAAAPSPVDARDPATPPAAGATATGVTAGGDRNADAGTRNAGGDDRDTGADMAPAAPRSARNPAAAFYYTVQVGAFGEVERAEALQQDLARRYPEAAVHSDGTWSRVQVGLFDDREQAEALRGELASAGLAAIVVAAH